MGNENIPVSFQERILVVDDEAGLRGLLVRMIEGIGYQCLQCEDAFTAVEILDREHVDVVLTDMVMPKMTGMELLIHCRQKFPEMDVIVMTGYGKRYRYTDVIREGAVDFIEKPIDSDELEAKLQRLFREQRMRAELKKEIDVRRKAEEELLEYQLGLQELIDNRTRELREANRLLSLEVAEHKKTEEEVRAYAEKIKLFAYSVSHDLKTPAIAISGLANLLEKKYLGGNSEKVAEICRQVSNTSNQLMSLVDNINLYIKAKETPVFLEDVSVAELFDSIYHDFRLELEERNVMWQQTDEPATVRADRLALIRVFRNFVDNSLRYGGERLSTIRLGFTSSENHHIFSVHDDGIGVGDDEKESIFELFCRSKGSVAKQGSGLGLAIVREIAEKHNGHTWVEASKDGGTDFYFSIDRNLGMTE